MKRKILSIVFINALNISPRSFLKDRYPMDFEEIVVPRFFFRKICIKLFKVEKNVNSKKQKFFRKFQTECGGILAPFLVHKTTIFIKIYDILVITYENIKQKKKVEIFFFF